MWTLRSSKSTPFGRKITVGAGICGLSNRIEMVTSIPRDPDDPLRKLNPLGKLPTLVLEDGYALFDSPVILEWLDEQAGGGKIIPRGGRERFVALRLQAIGDGMMDASVTQMSERRYHAEEISQVWMDYQRDKVLRALTFVTNDRAVLSGGPHVGHIALACALAYLDFRFDGYWRDGHPELVRWLEEFEARVPSFAASAHPK